MIVGDPYKIAIQIEKIDVMISPTGMFNFIIDDVFIPGRGVDIDLYVVISFLKEYYPRELQKNIPDLGNKKLEEIDFSDDTPESCIKLDTGILEEHFGCSFYIGFDGNEERLFFSTDYWRTYQEKRYPRGTIEKVWFHRIHTYF